MTLKNPTCKLVLVFFMLLLSSCAETINNLSTELYTADGFSSVLLSREGLAITPTAKGAGNDEETRMIGLFLDTAIEKKFSGSKLIKADQIALRLNSDQTLKSFWIKIVPHISAHSVRGMADARAFAKLLGVRYLMETEIQMAEIAGGAEQVRIYGRIYDAKEDRIVWEGVGEGRGYEKLIFPTTPATFRVIAQTAVNGLVNHLYDQ